MPRAGNANLSEIKSLIRTVPDFPKPGIMFRDVSTLIKDAGGFDRTIKGMVNCFKDMNVDKVVAIESRGFILGAPVAQALGTGLVMARKPGKLPAEVEELEYQLEYGTDKIQIHKDAISRGDRCLVIDDLLATGGTANATCQLVEKLGGVVIACGFVVNLPELKGTERLARYHTSWLVEFDGH
jgi:adenine phosphoribosyltransferase